MQSKTRAVIAEVSLPEGTIAGADKAFEHALLLALCKLDFVDRRNAAGRGAPLLDFAQLDLSEAALTALAKATDDDDVTADDDLDEGDRLQQVRRRVERAVPDAAERRAALELLAYAIENAHDERRRGGPCKTARAGCGWSRVALRRVGSRRDNRDQRNGSD